MLHDKNFRCHIGLCISQQYFLGTITAYNAFPSSPWQAPFSWGIVLQAALLNCCLSSRGNIQHLWFSMNIIFRSCKVLWRWKQTLAEDTRVAVGASVLAHLAGTSSEPGWEQVCLIKCPRAAEVGTGSGQLRELKEWVTSCPPGSESLNLLWPDISLHPESQALLWASEYMRERHPLLWEGSRHSCAQQLKCV